eukprot:CAMPEP_0119291384 /NCGR_PEP_ID=MMETSP1329-20130426/42375_1 /TAXON_ID=114041 /ORGANISM="Genus nov. species nov., Strain RCC1024" /LENGTH=45 /DNA_ID= /DNA_START= /DNA_END= /DNA_ORIENTATION=
MSITDVLQIAARALQNPKLVANQLSQGWIAPPKTGGKEKVLLVHA